MNAVYLHLPTSCDLCLAALEVAHEMLCWGLGDCTVHVSPAFLESDRKYLDELVAAWPGRKGTHLTVVSDPEVTGREWFVDIAGMRVGSRAA